jgi:hypothetical protein
MKIYISQKEYCEIDKLVARTKGCSSKKAAEPYLKQIGFLANQYDGSVRNILSELDSDVSGACGNVTDATKANHFVFCSLFKLKSFVKNNSDGSVENE